MNTHMNIPKYKYQNEHECIVGYSSWKEVDLRLNGSRLSYTGCDITLDEKNEM